MDVLLIFILLLIVLALAGGYWISPWLLVLLGIAALIAYSRLGE